VAILDASVLMRSMPGRLSWRFVTWAGLFNYYDVFKEIDWSPVVVVVIADRVLVTGNNHHGQGHMTSESPCR